MTNHHSKHVKSMANSSKDLENAENNSKKRQKPGHAIHNDMGALVWECTLCAASPSLDAEPDSTGHRKELRGMRDSMSVPPPAGGGGGWGPMLSGSASRLREVAQSVHSHTNAPMSLWIARITSRWLRNPMSLWIARITSRWLPNTNEN